MPERTPFTAYQRRVAELGEAIRARRLAKGWLQKDLGREVALGHTAISHFERGTHIPRRDVTLRIDRALDAEGDIFKLRDEMDDNPDAGRVIKYLAKHSKAATIRQICSFWTPPLLETEEHIRLSLEAGMSRHGGDLDEKMAFRAKLCEIMLRPNAPRLGIVLREAVLRDMIGNEQSMRRQLLYLVERSHEPNIDLRVLPFGVGSGVNDVGFVTMWEDPNGHRGAWHPQGTTDGLFISGHSAITALNNLYDHLHQLALDQEATRQFITKVVEELYPCRPNIPSA
ncbi:helix-turn-helix domain-containing protein [Streptomyces huiliensis]|uniref:helix-turn-helix domain-containing protein n=1 Tax=Streptomyces huiliensis TaxID=2876027 RepID=UPI001CBCAA44|nr:helix-turn-helix transcriptional regulator [Streptomyces huiliensis]MBZ4322634.1 helix-turn-helix transcriptional regulator [Streptomyces huiliensis]